MSCFASSRRASTPATTSNGVASTKPHPTIRAPIAASRRNSVTNQRNVANARKRLPLQGAEHDRGQPRVFDQADRQGNRRPQEEHEKSPGREEELNQRRAVHDLPT